MVAFLLVCLKQNRKAPKIEGSLKNIENNLHKLMSSGNKYAFLIIGVSGTEDFIQFSGDDNGVQIDFPIITDRQKQTEPKVREYAKENNLTFVENKGSDGSRFLDINLNDNPSEIAEISKGLLKSVYKVSDSTVLMFQLKT